MLINHARTLAHICFIPPHVGDVALLLLLTLEPIVIHIVTAGVTIIQSWDRLLCVEVCRFVAILLDTLSTSRVLVVCVGDLPPRLLLLF